MKENLAGLIKIVGIVLLLVTVWGLLSIYVPDKFLSANNIENLLRRTALYGILGIGVAFVIMTSGIDLSIGSLVCLCACFLAIFLHVDYTPIQSADVWEVRSGSRTIVIADSIELKAGQAVRLFDGRKVRNQVGIIQSIKQVRFDEGTAQEIVIDQDLTRDDKVDDAARMVAKLTPLLSIRKLANEPPDGGPAQVVLAGAEHDVRPRDRLWMVSGPRGMAEETIVRVERTADETTLYLKGNPVGVDSSWMAILVKRQPRMSVPLAILSVLGIALLLGLIHGLLVTKLRQQPFVVTLCGLMIYRGLARRMSNEQTLGFGDEYTDSLGALATGRFVVWESADGLSSFGIPYVFFILLAVAGLAAVFLNLTIWGRYILALGKNQEAAKYSGINTDLMICLTYVICALTTGLGGILHAIDANSISPGSFGNWFELWAIAAAVLGGCSLRGGEGGIFGVIVGTALMQTLYNMIVLLKIPSEMEFVIIGSVILIGVVSDELIRRVAGAIRSRDKR